MPDTVRFCYGCNERYLVRTASHVCPVCSEVLGILPSASTREIAAALEGRETLRLDFDLSESEDELVGEKLGTYTIEAFLGKGGMARVYRAKHNTLHRPCAVKILSPQLVARDPRHVSLFLAEARNAAALVHPHVVTVHNIGQDKDYHYIEMEYVNGCSLRRFVADEGPLDVCRATTIITQVCSALAEAHHIGIVHRDMKPANILIEEEKRTAKLADFGLAKKVVAGESDINEKGLAGTPYFMAPELFEGESASPRSDVYAVGVTYFFVLSGKLPFLARSVAQLAALHRSKAVPDLTEIGVNADDDVLRVLNICLAKEAGRRYPNAGALWEELRSILGNLRDIDLLVTEVLDGLQFEWEGGEGRYSVMVTLAEGRSQRVYIEIGSDEPRLGKLVRIYSICAPVDESYYRRALELNADMPHGSIAIQNLDDKPHYIMVDTYPQSTCDPEEIRRSVLSMARWSDDVEKVLTDKDKY